MAQLLSLKTVLQSAASIMPLALSENPPQTNLLRLLGANHLVTINPVQTMTEEPE